MKGYSSLDISSSSCVRFIRNTEIDGSESLIFGDVLKKNIKVSYVNILDCSNLDIRLSNLIGSSLKLNNAPYYEREWLCLADDLITMSYKENGVVIVIDNAWSLLESRKSDLFDLVESFLSQFGHWFEKKKPCYLCLQMEPDSDIGLAIGREL